MLFALAGHGGSGSGKGVVQYEVSVALPPDVECLPGNCSDETVDDCGATEKKFMISDNSSISKSSLNLRFLLVKFQTRCVSPLLSKG